MTDIYDHHASAFALVAAYVVMKDGERVATVAFKFPRDGAGRLWAYVHWFGMEMVRGHASGGGYDKRTAACASATRKMHSQSGVPNSSTAEIVAYREFCEALNRDGGLTWDSALRERGFTVLQAV